MFNKNLILLTVTLLITKLYALEMPEEGDPHARTWMGFPSKDSIHGNSLDGVQKNIALISKTISKYEPVNIIIQDQYEKEYYEWLLNQVPFASRFQISRVIQPIDDLWLRDSGPVFAYDQSGSLVGVDFGFNGWGNKQIHGSDEKLAGFINGFLRLPRVKSSLVLEGGALEIDGEGTAIISESCVLIDNRNPGKTKENIENELKALIGLDKIIWLPGEKGMEITDGHTDFYARFVGKHMPGTVLVHFDEDYPVAMENFRILSAATDAMGRKLNVIKMYAPNPEKVRPLLKTSTGLGYINFYVCNNAVIIPQFGDTEADLYAYNTMKRVYPKRIIEQINIDYIALGGGGIHCSTQQQPLA